MKTITIGQLKKLVNQKISHVNVLSSLKEEVVSNFGNSILTELSLSKMAENINDRLDVLERTGRLHEINLKPSVLLKFKTHKNEEVRKFVARTLPVTLIESFSTDKSDIVRHAAAKRLPLKTIKNMCINFPDDDQLFEIFKERKLVESTEKNNKAKTLSTLSKSYFDPELSDEWYKKKAKQFVMDYGSNLDYENLWISPTVDRYCKSIKSTLGIECEKEKLLGFIEDILEEKERFDQ